MFREREEDGLLEERVDEVAAEAMEMAAKEENVVYRVGYNGITFCVCECFCALLMFDKPGEREILLSLFRPYSHHVLETARPT